MDGHDREPVIEVLAEAPRLHFGEEKGGTYREKLRHETVDLDGLTVSTRGVRQVQVRTVVGDETEKLTEAYLVFDNRVIRVERSEDRPSLEEYSVRLRELFGIEGASSTELPISPSPTDRVHARVFSGGVLWKRTIWESGTTRSMSSFS